MNDGARDALAGYLYQIFGAAGIGARAHGGLDDADQLTCDLVLLAQQSRILHEVHEDVLLQHQGEANEATAVQFKYSRNAGSTPMEPADLREILHTFDRSREAAAPALSLTGFILVTNRPLSPSARWLYRHRDQLTPFAELTERERNWLILRNKKAPAVKNRYGSLQSAAEAWHTIFRQLRIFAEVHAPHWLDGLRSYATARGLPPEEFEACASRLVGEAVRGTIQNQLELSQGWLNKTLIGFPDARPLSLRAAGDTGREAARQCAEDWYANLVTAARTVIRRDLIDAVAEQAARFPIVLLLGDGGCGKSVLAGRFVCEEAARRFVGSVSARDYHRHWLGEVFNEWRSGAHGDDLPVLPAKEVIRRVRLANEVEERPLLVVNVDGLDEASDEHLQELRRLLYACYTQQPPGPYGLVVLLTARLIEPNAEQTRDRLIRNLTSVHFPRELAHQFGFVYVRDFSADELQTAIAEMPGPHRWRLEESLRFLSWQPSQTATLGDELGPGPTNPVADRALLMSLRHPALWGEFLDLGVEVQGRVLDGQREAMHGLAKRFLDRFFHKVLLRHPTWPDQGVRQALARIGHRFPPGELRGRRSQHWLVPARGPLRDTEARDLFHEAVSYGMILVDEGEWWRWRHSFVGDCLRNLEE
jgi:hypothetical protein